MKKKLNLIKSSYLGEGYIEYTIVNDRMEKDFFVAELQEDCVNKFPDVLSEPHSHNYYTILCFVEGEGSVIIDFNEYKIRPRTIFFMPPGQIHQMKGLKNFRGANLSFSEDFLRHLSSDVRNAIIPRLFLSRDMASVCEVSGEGIRILIKDFNKMKSRFEKQADSELHNEYIASLLSIFFMDIIEHGIWYEQVVNSEDSRAYELYLGFINLVDKNFRTLHSSEDYAKMMSTSLSTLTRCVSSVAGKTPFKVINERIIIEAKRMLFEKTSMRIKEIAFELGFTDNSNFVKFFKRNTGMSPVEFRESH